MPEFRIQPRLFPPASWFCHLLPGTSIVFDKNARWNKRDKLTHRYEIADVNGPVALTVPVTKPESFTSASIADIGISRHGNWWHVHRETLESAYGRTPFFEFYFPRYEKFFSENTVDSYPCLWQYLLDTTRVTAQILQLDNTFTFSDGCSSPSVLPLSGNEPEEPYWQVRADKFGFLAGLSVLDLIFNLGPESALYIRRMSNR